MSRYLVTCESIKWNPFLVLAPSRDKQSLITNANTIKLFWQTLKSKKIKLRDVASPSTTMELASGLADPHHAYWHSTNNTRSTNQMEQVNELVLGRTGGARASSPHSTVHVVPPDCDNGEPLGVTLWDGADECSNHDVNYVESLTSSLEDWSIPRKNSGLVGLPDSFQPVGEIKECLAGRVFQVLNVQYSTH